MNKEFSSGAIIFRKEKDSVSFLLIYSKRNKIWGFPKGHIEPGENETQTALREIAEETGLSDLRFIQGFRLESVYNTISKRLPFKGEVIEKHSIYFLCGTNTKEIKVDGVEISDFKWVEPENGMGLLYFGELKKILEQARSFLKEKSVI